jgi:hypothetical protein
VTLPLVDVVETATVRLVPTAYCKPPVLRTLVDDEAELKILESIEGLTNRRLRAQRSGLPELDHRELILKAWGHTHINAAFAYTRPEGNRFNGKNRGAWYCAFDDLTAIDEVAYHRTRELKNIGHFRDEGVYQALLAGFIGVFHDLRDAPGLQPCLDQNPAIGYPAGQELAQRLRADQSRGLVYPSVRRLGGACLVAFEPHLVQNVRPGARWKLTWNGTPDYTITTA